MTQTELDQLTNEDFKKLADQSSWQIAEFFGCHFSGDFNPIDHGGLFYDSRNWKDYGYACAVEFWDDPERENTLIVSFGTINKPDDMEAAFATIGHSVCSDIHMQIEAARAYSGIELDNHLTYNRNHWKDWRIWKSVAPFLRELGDI